MNRKSRISKAGNAYIRAVLYMPAIAAATHNPAVRAYYRRLVDEKGKTELVAQVAVMRKLLHAIYGMFASNSPFDGAKFYPAGYRVLT